MRYKNYSVSVVGSYWFQKGKLLGNLQVNYSKHFSSHKQFQTKKKVESFLRYLSSLNNKFSVEIFDKSENMIYTIEIN